MFSKFQVEGIIAGGAGGKRASFSGRLGREMSSSAERANASAEEEVISLEREIEETKIR